LKTSGKTQSFLGNEAMTTGEEKKTVEESTTKSAREIEPPEQNVYRVPRYMNFMNFSLASSMSSAETVVAPRSLAKRSISLRAMG